MKRLQQVQNFLAEQYDESNISNHYSMHVQQDPETNHLYIRSGSIQARINHIRSGSLAARIRNLITKTAETEIPKQRETRVTPLSDEEKAKLKQYLMSKRAQSFDPRQQPQSGSNLINPGTEESRAFYTSVAQKRKETIAEEVIGRIGPTNSSDLSALYMKKTQKDEKTPEGKEETNTRISRIRNLIHGRIKAGMEDAARQYGSASIRTSEYHGNPFDIQAQNDLRHAQIKMQRHNAQLQRFVDAHHALALKGAEDKFLTGDEMGKLTALSANLTKRQLGQIKQAVLSAQTEGEVGEVF